MTEFSQYTPLVEEAQEHWLYTVIPRHRDQIRWYDLGHWTTWTLFGNDDDGIFGEEPSSHWRQNEPIHGRRALTWGLRNPLHNFCFHVIGSASRKQNALIFVKASDEGIESFKYLPQADTVFAGSKRGFYLALHGWKPFVSLALTVGQRQGKFYIGWRERGNFGVKCQPASKLR